MRTPYAIVFCVSVLVVSAVARDDRPAQFYLVTFAGDRGVSDLKQSTEAAGVRIVGIAPEARWVVRATEDQLNTLRSTIVAADPVVAETQQASPRNRGLGARRPTREEWESVKTGFVAIESVQPNELAKLRELLDRASTVDNSVSQYFPPIRSQGSQGSCTAWAAGYYYNTYTQAKDEGRNVSGGDHAFICSPAFLYPLENDGEDNGAYTYSVVQRLNAVGCASWAIMPYSASDWTTWPDEAQWMEAMPRRTLTAYSIGNGSLNGCSASEFVAIKQLLANGEVLVTDTDVHSTWYDHYPRKTNGIDNAVLFGIDGVYLGGHAMTVVGYDDTRTYFDGTTTQTGAFLLANSWGTWWGASNTVGQRGYMWVAYSLFTNYNGYFGVAYYNSDRTNYVPRLYAVSGLNHARRSYVRYRGGVGPTSSPLWISSSVISNDGGSSLSITNNRRVAVDLTDGRGYVTNLNDVRLFVEMRVRTGAGSAGTISSADFFHDFESDGILSMVPSTSPVVTVNQNSSGYATVQFSAAPVTNLYVIITNPPSDVTVPYTTAAWNVAGLCDTSVAGHLQWTNVLTGAAGTTNAATTWILASVPLDVGTNVIVVRVTNSPAAARVAWDVPTNAFYANGWHSQDHGGYGFGVWSLAGGTNAGHFIATKAANTNLDIATTAWGLWANNGEAASGTRFLAQPLKVGGRFQLKFEHHWIESGRSVGVAWRNILGEYLLEFLFLGGGTNYLINDETISRPTGVPFTDQGFTLDLVLTGSNTYTLAVGNHFFSGTLKARGNTEIRQFHVWNYSAGSGPNYDVFFADLAIREPAPAGIAAMDVVRIVREPPVYRVWEVRSEWGTPAPPVGIYTSLFGTILTNRVDVYDERGMTQFECVGWTLLDHEPATGTTNAVVLELTNDTVLTWRWTTNFALAAMGRGGGTVVPTYGWYRAGSHVTVTAQSDTYFHFAFWTGDVPETTSASNPVTLTMDRPREISAIFAEDVTPVYATPHWWLAAHGWTNEFEMVESEDPDGDGYSTWQEWVALTDPTNRDDALSPRALASDETGYVIEWPGRSNRTYWVLVQTNVSSGPIAEMGPIYGPQSSFTDTTYHVLSPVLYRVGVRR